jgi:hypothetical protein
MRFQKSQPIETGPTSSPDWNPIGPLKNMDAYPPAQKRTPMKYTKTLAALHKSGVGTNHPRSCSVVLSGCASS